MGTITRWDLVTDTKKAEEFGAYIWVKHYSKKAQKDFEDIYFISLEDIKGMVTLEGEYELVAHTKPKKTFKPQYCTYIEGRHSYFEGVNFTVIFARILSSGYFRGLLTKEEFVELAVAHYKGYYERKYNNKYKANNDFFDYFLKPYSLHSTWDAVTEALQPLLNESGTTGYTAQGGGDFAGFWTDDMDRVRPRHNPKYAYTEYADWEKVKFALMYDFENKASFNQLVKDAFDFMHQKIEPKTKRVFAEKREQYETLWLQGDEEAIRKDILTVISDLWHNDLISLRHSYNYQHSRYYHALKKADPCTNICSAELAKIIFADFKKTLQDSGVKTDV